MTDEEYIQTVVDQIRELWSESNGDQANRLSSSMYLDDQFRHAVARHLLSRDPESVRVPMKGTVT